MPMMVTIISTAAAGMHTKAMKPKRSVSPGRVRNSSETRLEKPGRSAATTPARIMRLAVHIQPIDE